MAVRVELFDDEVDSLQFFDPLTGRVRQKIPRFTVYPSSHYVTPRERVLSAIDTIKAELRERLAELVAAGKLVEAQRLEQRTRFDLEMLQEVGHCKGIENYTRHLSGARPGDPPPTLVDYLPRDAIMSESRFSRFFRRATGNNFVDFVNRVRINRACQLLMESDCYIAHICYEVGFNNVANFNRRFLEIKGMRPSNR